MAKDAASPARLHRRTFCFTRVKSSVNKVGILWMVYNR